MDDTYFFSLKGEEGGDDDGEEAQSHLDGIAFNKAFPLTDLLENWAFVIGEALVLEGVLGVGGEPGVWHAFGGISVLANGVGEVLTEVASAINLSAADGDDGESSLSKGSAGDVTIRISIAYLATVGAWGAGLSVGVVAIGALVAGSGQVVAISTVVNSSVDAGSVTIECFASSAGRNRHALAFAISVETVFAGLAVGSISALLAANNAGCASIASLLVSLWEETWETFGANTFGTASIASGWAGSAGLLISASEVCGPAFRAFTIGIACPAVFWAGGAFAFLDSESRFAFGAFTKTSAFGAAIVTFFAGAIEEIAGGTGCANGGVSGTSSAEGVGAMGAGVVEIVETRDTSGAWA